MFRDVQTFKIHVTWTLWDRTVNAQVHLLHHVLYDLERFEFLKNLDAWQFERFNDYKKRVHQTISERQGSSIVEWMVFCITKESRSEKDWRYAYCVTFFKSHEKYIYNGQGITCVKMEVGVLSYFWQNASREVALIGAKLAIAPRFLILFQRDTLDIIIGLCRKAALSWKGPLWIEKLKFDP